MSYEDSIDADTFVERHLICEAIRAAERAGYRLRSFEDSEHKVTRIKSTGEGKFQQVLELHRESYDGYSWIHFRHKCGSQAVIKLVCGNGADVISDYGPSSGPFDEAMSKVYLK